MTISILLFRIKRYVLYWLYRVDEHSLQAPFIFDLYRKVFKVKRKPNKEVLELWAELKRNRTTISSESGAGSLMNQKKYRVDRIAKHGVTSLSNASLVSGLIEHLQVQHVLELGTSLGIHSCIMASMPSVKELITVEKNQELARIASANFERLRLKQVSLVPGDVEDYLNEAVSQSLKFNLIYVDANHTYEATLTYSEMIAHLITKDLGVVIYDDINWSPGMRKAWEEISCSFTEGVVLETFQMGILIYKSGLQSQHHIVSY